MKAIWVNVRSGWNIVKVFRVAMALAILVPAVNQNNISFVFIGVLFLLFSLLTPGSCCTMYSPGPSKEKADLDSTNYEELGETK